MKHSRQTTGHPDPPVQHLKGGVAHWLGRTAVLTPPILSVAFNLGVLAAFGFLHMDTVIRIAYNTNTITFPIVFAAAGLALMRLPAPGGRKRRGIAVAWLASALVLVGVRVYATHIEPRSLQVREVSLASAKVHAPLTILHLTDIQSAGIGPWEEKVFAEIRRINPDLILYTGDFLQPTGGATLAGELPKLRDLFATLDPPLGIYAVAGESDTAILDASPDELGGVRFLHTEAVELESGGTPIRILGLALGATLTRRATPVELIAAWYESSPPDALTIILGHRPDYITRLLDLPIDLCLAGHTHGGQVRVPFYGPIVTSSGAPRAWARGFREEGATRLNVSAGIGAGHNKGLPSIRFNCPPEMTVIRFLPKAAT